jgi:ferredoxin
MPWVVTERCRGCRYTDCVSVCPTDCFYELSTPYQMVVIDPDACVDCSLCETTCPVHAIYKDDEVPEPYAAWVARNRELFSTGINITTKKDPLPTAVTLEEIQRRERERGLVVYEPPTDR